MKRYLKQEDFLRMILMYILCLGKSWELLAHPGLYTRRSFLVAVGAHGEPCCFSLEIYHPCPIHLNWVGLTLLELTHLTRSQVVIFKMEVNSSYRKSTLERACWKFWRIVTTRHSFDRYDVAVRSQVEIAYSWHEAWDHKHATHTDDDTLFTASLFTHAKVKASEASAKHAGVQFSRDSIHAFNNRVKIREKRGL